MSFGVFWGKGGGALRASQATPFMPLPDLPVQDKVVRQGHSCADIKIYDIFDIFQAI